MLKCSVILYQSALYKISTRYYRVTCNLFNDILFTLITKKKKKEVWVWEWVLRKQIESARLPVGKKALALTLALFCGAGGSNFIDPLAPVLQISTAICLAANSCFVFVLRSREPAPVASYKNKTTSSRRWQCLLDRGAGGSRTRVQARRPYAFYMLSPAWLSGKVSCRTT